MILHNGTSDTSDSIFQLECRKLTTCLIVNINTGPTLVQSQSQCEHKNTQKDDIIECEDEGRTLKSYVLQFALEHVRPIERFQEFINEIYRRNFRMTKEIALKNYDVLKTNQYGFKYIVDYETQSIKKDKRYKSCFSLNNIIRYITQTRRYDLDTCIWYTFVSLNSVMTSLEFNQAINEVKLQLYNIYGEYDVLYWHIYFDYISKRLTHRK